MIRSFSRWNFSAIPVGRESPFTVRGLTHFHGKNKYLPSTRHDSEAPFVRENGSVPLTCP